MQQDFYDDHTGFARFFYNQVVAMHNLIKKNPQRVARILSADAGGNPTWRQFKQWLAFKDRGSKRPALTWTTRPLGLMRTAAFMNRTGQLSKAPNSWRELVFPPVYPTKGS
jgi:hypothetical protein